MALLITVVANGVRLWLDWRKTALDLVGMADNLARAVGTQWKEEAGFRNVYRPYAISVRWKPADQALFVDWSLLTKLATSSPGHPVDNWASGPKELAGSGSDIGEVFNRVPTGRLVVLGEPGAGKTTLLVRLLLELLSRRGSGEPVPLLLSLASWDPEAQDLRSWIEQRLINEWIFLAEPAPSGKGASRARALLDAGLIVPVLDDLDEISAKVRGSAIDKINDALRPGERLVLAARTAEYREAVCPPGKARVRLTGAAGITLCSVDPQDASEYLRESTVDGAARWDTIVATFGADNPPPVAQALTIPLLLALARAIYNPQPGESLVDIPEPIELLGFATYEEVKQHLLHRFIPAAYRGRADKSRRSKWTSDQAERWLAFLAHNLEYRRQGDTNLAWWTLPRAAPRPLDRICVGLVAGLAGALGFPFPVEFGLGLIVVVGVGLLLRSAVQPGRVSLTAGFVGGLVGGLLGAVAALAAVGVGVEHVRVVPSIAGGFACGIAVAAFSKFWIGLVAAFVGAFFTVFSGYAVIGRSIGAVLDPFTHLIIGIGTGVAAGVAVGLANRSTPARELHWSRAGFVCGLACGLLAGVLLWMEAGFLRGLIFGLLVTVTSGYVAGRSEAISLDPTSAASPGAELARDRTTFWLSCLGVGLTLGLGTGLVITSGVRSGFQLGLEVGLANLVAVGLSYGFMRASWGSFTIARWWLAASRQLPWRLMQFLADAHEHRGVLRQAGAFYQFRHVELQRHLANKQRHRAAESVIPARAAH